MTSPLITAANRNTKREAVLNYIIAGIAGATIGAMLALAI